MMMGNVGLFHTTITNAQASKCENTENYSKNPRVIYYSNSNVPFLLYESDNEK